jgi:protein-tyrosine phosphatase
MTKKLLFVCLGNICRSPAAEGIMNHLIEQASLKSQITCDSAGTSNYHIGEPPDQRMVQAARQREILLQGSGRQFQLEDFADFDLILAMDQENYHTLLFLDRAGRYHDKIRLICEFCTHHSDQEVPDPYYGGALGFQYVIDLLLDACEGLLRHLTQVETVS